MTEDAEHEAFRADVIAGLSATPRAVPGKHLWDERGSDLFDRITAHPDYYPMRAEMALLPEAAAAIARRIGPGATVVEFGSGASRKIRTLLDALPAPARYVAVDISAAYLDAAVRRLATDYPDVAMIPVAADYSRPIRLPVDLSGGPVLGFFPGTTIGNVPPEEAVGFLARVRAALGAGHLLIGADPNRDPAQLRAAYGDCSGLMPAFHRNLLARLARDLGADLEPDAFVHEARILPDPFRMEAHLVACRPTRIAISGHTFEFAAGDSVRTDFSYKHAPDTVRTLAGQAGWTPEDLWLDTHESFSLHLLRCT
ncbi:L-histidine N(alpha)-methyltransferase [Methylobacterium sp. A54F]